MVSLFDRYVGCEDVAQYWDLTRQAGTDQNFGAGTYRVLRVTARALESAGVATGAIMLATGYVSAGFVVGGVSVATAAVDLLDMASRNRKLSDKLTRHEASQARWREAHRPE